jgi:hypothetical protein
MTTRKFLALAMSIAAATLALPASASAGPLVATASGCADQSLGQPFLPWADVASYTLDPGGDFEHRAGWALAGGASIVDGNEPAFVGSATDSHSLAIPAGASATSPSLCVGIEHPDMRFFATASTPAATLTVEVLFEDAMGNVRSASIGVVAGSTKWAPTAPFPLVVNLLPLLPDSRTAVAFRFSASGGSFRVDDVYVDPYRSR